MKKILISIIVILAAAVSGRAQERVYLALDRSFYAAGENVYCSAYCLDENGGLSGFSGVAYVELYSSEGLAARGKIGLSGGRGAGSISLPSSLPTGNYRLLAYTALDRNIQDFDYEELSHIISVYNTSTGVKVPGGVKITDAPSARPMVEDIGPVAFRISESGRLEIVCSEEMADVAVSLYRDEPIGYTVDGVSLASRRGNTATATLTGAVTPEYDGEILSAVISDLEGNPIDKLSGSDIYIGCPGSDSDMYAASIGPDGKVSFYTANIYGKKDMAVMLKEKVGAWKVEFTSPFVEIKPSPIPVLEISEDFRAGIEALGTAANITAAFDADTLYSRMPIRSLPFLGDGCKTYKLDDYKRFTSMQEVFTEIIGGISVKDDSDNGRSIFIRCEDNFNQVPLYSPYPALALLDGVPVLDHSLLLAYDPMQVKTVEVYPYEYSLGNIIYSGVISFKTYKGMMENFKFGDNVKIVSFDGVSYPLSFSSAAFPAKYPSVRQTIYWQPSVTIKKGVPFVPDYIIPSIPGTYILKVEGLTASGKPVFCTIKLTEEERPRHQ